MFSYPPFPDFELRIRCVEMHTGGEPLRVIIDGFPETKGKTVLERRRDCLERHDDLRKLLINEPRGHADMYAALLVPPNLVGDNGVSAHFGVIFMHNAGYSTMCGHATIALAKLAVESGWVAKAPTGETEVRIDAPCGRVVAFVSSENKSPVRFIGVPSFVGPLNQSIELPNWGKVNYDISYGGAFYAYVDVSGRDMAIDETQYENWIRFGRDLKNAIIDRGPKIEHPTEPDLSFLYGAIFMGPAKSGNDSRNVCVFANGEIDRCPTGSGVCGRLALHLAKGELVIGQELNVESIVDSVFVGKVLSVEAYGGGEAVIPEVRGDAYITGHSTFTIDPRDRMAEGFLLR